MIHRAAETQPQWILRFGGELWIYFCEGGTVHSSKAENMTILYGNHAMSIVQRQWCDHEGTLCVMIFDVKVQLHQFGSNPQQPEDHDPSHRPIKNIVCPRLSLFVSRGIPRSGEPGKDIVSQGF